MTLDDYTLQVFLIDDQLATLHLDYVRQRGFAPLLHDSEVLTIELRKIVSHTIAAWINVSQGHRPLDFASLVTE